MSATCCETKTFEGVSPRYKRVLIAVILINAALFGVEVVAGQAAQSQALWADALDFLADAITYGLSLWAIGKAASLRAKVAMAKGISLSLMGLGVLGTSLWRFFTDHQPEPVTMGWVAVAALLANVASVVLLMAYREGDANVRSVWLCSRNDAIGNIAVMIAAGLVAVTSSGWPDLLVATLMAILFLTGSVQILRQSSAELRAIKPAHS